MRLHELEARKEASARGDNIEDQPEAEVPKRIEWRKGKAREFIIGGLAFCVAYSDSDQWTSAGANKPSRLLRLKGACLLTGYTGNLEEFRRKPNQPIFRVGGRATSPDEPKSTVEDLCQEIENVTRINAGSPMRSMGTHFSLSQAFAQRRLTDDEYIWIMTKVRQLKAEHPTREAMALAAEDYAKQIELVFEGAQLEPGEEAKLEYSDELIKRVVDRPGVSEQEVLDALSLLGCAPDEPVVDGAPADSSEDDDIFK